MKVIYKQGATNAEIEKARYNKTNKSTSIKIVRTYNIILAQIIKKKKWSYMGPRSKGRKQKKILTTHKHQVMKNNMQRLLKMKINNNSIKDTRKYNS